VTATTLSAQRTWLTGRGRSGADAQERAATNPVAALPCARTPLLDPLPAPLLHPLLAPSSATAGSRWVAGAVVSGRPPTNFAGGLPAGSPGHPRHERWSDG
jgi:hypothetical protein